MNLNSRKGFTLIEIIAALGIAAAGLLVINAGLTTLKQSAQKIDYTTSLTDLRARLLGGNGINCENTFRGMPNNNPCAGGAYIDIRGPSTAANPQGQIIIGQNGRNFGDWALRAYCNNAGIEIRAASLLPRFQSEVSRHLDWIANPTPADLSVFKRDHSTNTIFSYTHPQAVISRPGPSGICTERFQNQLAHPGCPRDHYLVNVNFDTNDIECRPSRTCTPPDALRFSGSGFECTRDTFNEVIAEGHRFLASEVNRARSIIDRSIDPLVSDIIRIRNRFEGLLDPRNDYQIRGDTAQQCASVSRMRCRSGYLMSGYAFRYEGGRCTANCTKIIP